MEPSARSENSTSKARRFLMGVGRALLMWGVLVLAVILGSFPHLPSWSRDQWLWLALAGPPTYILGETFFGWTWNVLGRQPLLRQSAVARIAVAVAVVLLSAAVLVLLGSWLDAS
jgi:hypothetical protein